MSTHAEAYIATTQGRKTERKSSTMKVIDLLRPPNKIVIWLRTFSLRLIICLACWMDCQSTGRWGCRCRKNIYIE